MLQTVTLTGADESVTAIQLIELSQEFPFVEWGILIGSGTCSRFPSVDWIRGLVEQCQDVTPQLNLSLHICGKFLREIAAGKSTLLEHVGPHLGYFRRCQLNWHAQRQGDIAENILGAFCGLMPWEPEIIFQQDGVNGDLASGAIRRFLCSGLFDCSHGAGVSPDEWPEALTTMRSGWAGGLGPDNIATELPRIAAKAHRVMPYWIDMEAKLRSDGDSQFDLAKCRSVLEQCVPFVGK